MRLCFSGMLNPSDPLAMEGRRPTQGARAKPVSISRRRMGSFYPDPWIVFHASLRGLPSVSHTGLSPCLTSHTILG